MLAAALVVIVQFRTQIENLVLGNGRWGLEGLSQKDERFISKRLAGLLKYTYLIGKQRLGSPEHQLVESQLVEDLYSHLLEYLYSCGLVQ